MGKNIPKSILRDLKKTAAKLPKLTQTPSTTTVRVQWGHTILEEDPGAKLPSGEKVDPNKRYEREVFREEVDHYKNLKKAFVKGGYPACKSYSDSVIDHFMKLYRESVKEEVVNLPGGEDTPNPIVNE